MPCSGAASQTCGGRSRLNVFRDPAIPVPGAQSPLLGYRYVGCYTDPSASARLLTKFSFSSAAAMSQGTCVAACADRGFAFAGVEFGRECYCGDALNLAASGGGDGAAKGEKAASEDECDMLCSGDRAQFCGGKSRVGVWSVAGAQG